MTSLSHDHVHIKQPSDTDTQSTTSFALLTLLILSYFRPALYTKGGGGGGHLDPLPSHQYLIVQTSNFARY